MIRHCLSVQLLAPSTADIITPQYFLVFDPGSSHLEFWSDDVPRGGERIAIRKAAQTTDRQTDFNCPSQTVQIGVITDLTRRRPSTQLSSAIIIVVIRHVEQKYRVPGLPTHCGLLAGHHWVCCPGVFSLGTMICSFLRQCHCPRVQGPVWAHSIPWRQMVVKSGTKGVDVCM